MPKLQPIHTDILGQEIKEGDYVAAAHQTSLRICQITKINPKMIRVRPIVKGGYRKSDMLIYSSETILLNGEDAVAYILKYEKP